MASSTENCPSGESAVISSVWGQQSTLRQLISKGAKHTSTQEEEGPQERQPTVFHKDVLGGHGGELSWKKTWGGKGGQRPKAPKHRLDTK